MKNLSVAGLLAGLTVAASSAHAQGVEQVHGSDTLFDVVTTAINQAGLDSVLHYIGGGSGTGEAGLVNGTQGIAPMSRQLTAAAIGNLVNQGISPIQNVIGLDGVSLFVSSTNPTPSLTFDTIRAIYLCQITDWASVPGSTITGTIAVYARNGASGTTDTFKTLIGGLPATTVDANGVSQANWNNNGSNPPVTCVNEVATTEEIASHTANEPLAIGFAGLSAGRLCTDPGTPCNAKPAIARTDTSTPVAPSQDTIRDFSYPLARRLYVNQISQDGGDRNPNANEQALLDAMLDRGFLDPILTQFEFVTCPSAADGGCP